MYKRLFVVMFLVVLCVASRAQHAKPASEIRQPRQLQVTSTQMLSIPVFGYYGYPHADDRGDLYVKPSSASDPISIFRLSSDESKSEMFTLPSDGNDIDSLMDFAVTPDGTLYILGADAKPVFHVYAYDSDAKLKHKTTLETPDGVIIASFSVFSDGTILAAGFFDLEGTEAMRGKSFIALFNESGQLLSDLTKKAILENSKPDPSTPVNITHIRPGSDGNLYVLKQSSVLVINPGGAIIRSLKFKKPDPEKAATELYVGDGYLAVTLANVALGKPTNPQYLVMDASNGKEYGYYGPPNGLGKLGRFTREEGFVFLTSENKHMKLVTAKMN